MAKLYVITGPAGIGKTTISKELAKTSNKSALIEGDEIYSQIVGGYVSAWKEGNHLDVFWEICLNNINTYLKAGYDVVFNYIVNPTNFTKIQNQFANYDIKLVVLIADEKSIIERDKQRPLDCQMKERCIILLNNFKNYNFEKKHFLDTTNLSVNDTVKIIENENKFWLRKEITTHDFLNKTLQVKIDRPMGSKHPKYGFIYPINYGFVPNTISGDGEELDCYILGVYEPLETFEGKCIAIIHRLNDNDDKLIIVPENKNFTNSQIRALTDFQEQYFESIIIRT